MAVNLETYNWRGGKYHFGHIFFPYGVTILIGLADLQSAISFAVHRLMESVECLRQEIVVS